MPEPIKLDPFTVRAVANFFVFVVCPVVALLSYGLGYSDGKLTGWLKGIMGDKL